MKVSYVCGCARTISPFAIISRYSFNVGVVNGEWKRGARCLHQGKLRFLSYDGDKYLTIEAETLKTEVNSINVGRAYAEMYPESEDKNIFWLLPSEGTIVRRWNEETGDSTEFDLYLDGMEARNPYRGYLTNQDYFSSVAFGKDFVLFAPRFGNKFVKLNSETGHVEEWVPFCDADKKHDDDYCTCTLVGMFFREKGAGYQYLLYRDLGRKVYGIELENGEVEEVRPAFSETEIYENIHGFTTQSQWLRYACYEDVFHTLKDFLDGALPGEKFNRENQLEAYININFCSPIYYGLVNKSLVDGTNKDIYSKNPKEIIKVLNKVIQPTRELTLNNYVINNYNRFVFAVPRNYAYNDSGALAITFYLPDINSAEVIKANRNDKITPIFTDGITEAGTTTESDINSRELGEFKMQKFKDDVMYINEYGYEEEYMIFISNGYFTRLYDNIGFNIKVK